MNKSEITSYTKHCYRVQKDVAITCSDIVRHEIRHGIKYELSRIRRRIICEFAHDCGAERADCKYAVPYRRDISTKDYLSLG